MNPVLKGLVLVAVGVLATILTMGLCSIVLYCILSPRNCGQQSRALMTLWISMGVEVLVGLVGMIVASWRMLPGIGLRIGVVLAYGLAMLAVYAGIAFSLMIVFNC